MKTYQAPMLVAQGDVVALTQGMFIGITDPNGTSAKSPEPGRFS
jgi:hypothetical protein